MSSKRKRKNEDVAQQLELICAVCKETYKNPKLLHCMHTFCEECIQQMLLLLLDGNGKVVCPLCQIETEVGEDGTHLLWRNHIIQQKVKWQTVSSMRENNLIYCSECESDTATQLCCDCQWKLCNGCTSHHKKCVRYKTHTIQSIESVSTEELFEPGSIQCVKHMQDLKYYCKTCKMLTCGDCSHSEAHEGHFFRLMTEVIKEEMKSLRELLPTSEVSCSQYEVKLKKIEDFQRDSLQEKELSIKVVEQTFDELIDVIKKEKNYLLQWVNKDYESSEKALRMAKEEVQIVKKVSGYLGEVVKFPEEEIFDIVLQGVSQLKETVESMNKATPTDGRMGTADYTNNPNPGYSFATQFTNAPRNVASNSRENVFDVNACSRQIQVSGHLETIKSALLQITHSQGQIQERLVNAFTFHKKTFPESNTNSASCDESGTVEVDWKAKMAYTTQGLSKGTCIFAAHGEELKIFPVNKPLVTFKRALCELRESKPGSYEWTLSDCSRKKCFKFKITKCWQIDTRTRDGGQFTIIIKDDSDTTQLIGKLSDKNSLLMLMKAIEQIRGKHTEKSSYEGEQLSVCPMTKVMKRNVNTISTKTLLQDKSLEKVPRKKVSLKNVMSPAKTSEQTSLGDKQGPLVKKIMQRRLFPSAAELEKKHSKTTKEIFCFSDDDL